MHSALCQPTLDATSSPSLYEGRKISPVEPALLWSLMWHEDPECTSRKLLDKVAQHQAALALSVRQVNPSMTAIRPATPGRSTGHDRLSSHACGLQLTSRGFLALLLRAGLWRCSLQACRSNGSRNSSRSSHNSSHSQSSHSQSSHSQSNHSQSSNSQNPHTLQSWCPRSQPGQ
jgi:hypothetical protein